MSFALSLKTPRLTRGWFFLFFVCKGTGGLPVTYVLSLKQEWSYALFKYQLEDKLVYLQQQSLGGLTKYLTMKILGDLTFLLPSMDEQKQFEDFVAQIDKSKF